MEEERERRRSVSSLCGVLTGMVCGLAGNSCYSQGPGNSQQWGKGCLGGNGLWEPQEMLAGVKEGCHQCCRSAG